MIPIITQEKIIIFNINTDIEIEDYKLKILKLNNEYEKYKKNVEYDLIIEYNSIFLIVTNTIIRIKSVF